MNQKTYDQIFDSHLRIKLGLFPCIGGSHAFATIPTHVLHDWQLHGGVRYVSGSCMVVRYLESSFTHASEFDPTNDEHIHKHHTQSTNRGNTFETSA